ncbi:MAG: type II toxin-antitoxin system RelE/ParE family toxin [Bdellovibrionales bacterium]|nr:type II toxin-antitoxin system RelE/ParE family toxin [Bdellovibrionales bacterium]
MASYKVTLKKSVEKDLRRIDRVQVPKIVSAIQALSENPFPANSRKLVGSTKTYRVRLGDYRVLYIVDEAVREIEVQAVRHRKDAYRG